jgi:serine protease Do
MRRRKSVLLGSVFAVGLAGLVAGEVVIATPSPANAQTTTEQPMPPQARMMSFADLVQRVKPAVVSVRVKTDEAGAEQTTSQSMPFFFRQLPPDHPLRRFFEQQFPNQGQNDQPHKRQHHFGMAQGSGFFISADGYIVTNNHVVKDATDVEVITDAGKSLKAKVVGTDARTDLALLKVESSSKFPYVSFASKMPRIGDWVVAIGNPFGLGGTVTAGIVSARSRDIGAGQYDDYLQIDAPVNHGNSGGPSFDLSGQVVGINTAIYSPSGGNVGIAFDVPADVAIPVIEQLKEHGSVTRGYLGVQIQQVTQDIAESVGLKKDYGAMVVNAEPGTPAQKAGIKPGDVIVQLNDKDVKDWRDLSRRVAALQPGDQAKFTVWRNNSTHEYTVHLAKMPSADKLAGLNGKGDTTPSPKSSAQELAGLGIKLAPASEVAGAGDEGVVVTDVDGGGPAAQKLMSGDVILDAGGNKVSTPADIAHAMDQARSHGLDKILMRMKRQGRPHYVALPVNTNADKG